MSKHKADMLPIGLPKQMRSTKAGTAGLAHLTREDLRTLVKLLTRLRGYFEFQETRKPIDDTLEIVHALAEDWVRQGAERARHANNRRIATRRQRT